MSHNLLLLRVRYEYLEMPGMRLTLDQAQRLFGMEWALCREVLDELVAEQFLCEKPDGTFARLTEGRIPRRNPVKADLGARRRAARAS